MAWYKKATDNLSQRWCSCTDVYIYDKGSVCKFIHLTVKVATSHTLKQKGYHSECLKIIEGIQALYDNLFRICDDDKVVIDVWYFDSSQGL